MRTSILLALCAGSALRAGTQEAETAPPRPIRLEEPTSEGSLAVTPASGISGEFGTWTVIYTVGAGGIREGGGIRVQLPDAWHAGPRNSANRLQATDPTDDHYVSARVSRGDVKIETTVETETETRLVKHAKRSLDGRSERYVFVVRVRVTAGELLGGDEVHVVYGDRSGASRGYRAAAISIGARPVLVAIDRDGSSRFRLHTTRSATLTSLPGSAVELLLVLPSDGVAGEALMGTVALVDKEHNPVGDSARIRLTTLAGDVSVPESVTLPPGTGWARFRVIPESPGIVRLRAVSDEPRLAADSNPLDVRGEARDLRVYWGDLHSHSRHSWDGVGDESFAYARDVSALDFYALTDHAVAPDPDGTPRGLSAATWEEYARLPDAHYEPGRFVTLHAYECSMGRPFGHHNIYFRGRPGPLFYPSKSSLSEIWSALRAGDALTIPHHTGKFPDGVLWEPQNPVFRRNFEIYSGHGLSEAYDPEHPLAFEKSLFTADSKSLRHPSFAQDAWKAGLHLSTIASSDDHRSHPGMPHYGLVAALARELTRDAVFEALFERRTYATTGARILLDFTLNRHGMGSLVAVSAPPRLEVRAVGTDIISKLELLRFAPGDEAFSVAKRWEPSATELRAEHVDEAWRAGAIYYVRLRQRNLVRGLAVMAWSSPIWTVGVE